ncbi:ArsR family transcriptional regulator [Bacillus sp. UFRGS-B20]|nr:ArsR family transcriptional regulator [Bacillus sp. UFRGS-B20]
MFTTNYNQILTLPQSNGFQHLHKMKSHKWLAHERKGTEVFIEVDA